MDTYVVKYPFILLIYTGVFIIKASNHFGGFCYNGDYKNIVKFSRSSVLSLAGIQLSILPENLEQ